MKSAAEEKVRLEARNEELETRFRRNFSRSGKPRSTARPKVKKKQRKTGKPKGGVPGHPAHFRGLASPKQLNDFMPHSRVYCGQALDATMAEGEPVRYQSGELHPMPVEATAQQLFDCPCPNCGSCTVAHLPESGPRIAFGPRFTTFIAMVFGRFCLSHLEAGQLLVGGLTVTTHAPSTVTKFCVAVSGALEAPVAVIETEAQTNSVA